MPAARNEQMGQSEFAEQFVTTVLSRFVKSDYYKNMSESEREEAFVSIGKVLSSYSYGNVSGGFVNDFKVDMKYREITWLDIVDSTIQLLWTIPG